MSWSVTGIATSLAQNDWERGLSWGWKETGDGQKVALEFGTARHAAIKHQRIFSGGLGLSRGQPRLPDNVPHLIFLHVLYFRSLVGPLFSVALRAMV